MDLNFHEDGKDYKESITFDDETNTTEFHVPKHGRVPFDVDYLIDHNMVKYFCFLSLVKTGTCLLRSEIKTHCISI